ncbi:MAG: hypothetical protein JRG71_12465 [Deltaproteobacteria bacterium]|nr:hypothetical protein [Deltaproteobacteria bacterium]
MARRLKNHFSAKDIKTIKERLVAVSYHQVANRLLSYLMTVNLRRLHTSYVRLVAVC